MKTRTRVNGRLLSVVMASLAAIAGCGDDTVDQPPIVEPTGDAATDHTADAVTEAPPGESGPSQPQWVPDTAPTTGPAVVLSAATVQSSKLRIPVQGKGIDKLYGLAFRLEYDPSILRFESMTRGDAWTGGSGFLDLAKEGRSGLLVAAVTYKGNEPGVAVSDGTLAWVEFTLLKEAAVTVRFVSGRSALVRPDGTETAKVGWTGGAIVLQ